MKYKTKKTFVKYFNTLCWYCINWDFNSKKPVYINVIRYIDAAELFKRLTYSGNNRNAYNSITTQDEFYSFCRSQLAYYFRGNANFEMSLGDLHVSVIDSMYKLSVFDQIEPNINHIINYIITEMGLFFPLLDVKKSDSSGIKYV